MTKTDRFRGKNVSRKRRINWVSRKMDRAGTRRTKFEMRKEINVCNFCTRTNRPGTWGRLSDLLNNSRLSWCHTFLLKHDIYHSSKQLSLQSSLYVFSRQEEYITYTYIRNTIVNEMNWAHPSTIIHR